MSGIKLSQRLWLLADDTAQRAFDGFASVYDDTAKKLNNAFDFADKTLNVRVPMTAATVASAAGFKTVVGPWQRSSSAMSTTPTLLAWGMDSGASTTVAQGCVMPFSGSVLGIGLSGTATTATSVAVTVYQNLVPTAATLTFTLPTATASTFATFGKGAVTFAAGDRLDMYYVAAAANTGQFTAAFIVELAA